MRVVDFVVMTFVDVAFTSTTSMFLNFNRGTELFGGGGVGAVNDVDRPMSLLLGFAIATRTVQTKTWKMDIV